MAAEDGRLRVSDAERERIVEALRRHTADGRLTLEEFEQRVGEAYAATTRDDLGPVLRDLPPLPPATAPATTPRQRRSVWPSDLETGAVLRAVVVVAAVTVVIASGWQLWWIAFPLMGVFGGCGRGARSCGTMRSHHERAYDGSDGSPDADGEIIRV